MTNPKSQEFFQRARKLSPGGVHSPVRAFKGVGGQPLFFASAEGPYLRSVDGKEYIDLCQSFGPLLLGHRDPDVAKVVRETVDIAWTFGAPEPYSLELAEWITERVPWVERLRFVCSGTEAVMSALRVARAATGRRKILKFSGCYHGHTDSLLVQAGSGLAGTSASSSAGVPEELVAHTLILPLDEEKALDAVFRAHAGDIAAVVIEPLPANYGLLPQRREYLHYLAELARSYGTLVIFDEVISGFRVARGGMSELLGIRPDLVTYGKVIGGGFPVGCYGGRGDLMALVAPEGPVYQAGTLAANPFGMRAGLATLEKAFDGDAFSLLSARANAFALELDAILQKMDAPVRFAREGSVGWLHRTAGDSSPRSPERIHAEQGEWFKRFFHACLDEGIYLPPNAYEVYFLSTAHTEAVLARVLRGFRAALEVAHG